METGINPERFFFLSMQPICVADLGGGFKMVNPAMERLLGWNAKTLLTKPFFDFILPEDIEKTKIAYAEIMSGKPIVNFENRYRRENGEVVWVQWNAALDKGAGLIYAHANDVTSIKAEHELYKAVVDDQSELICRHLPDGTITFTNRAFALFFGISPKKLVGLKKGEIFPPETMNQLLAAHAKLTPENPIVSYEAELKSPLGNSYSFWWRNHGFFDADGMLMHVQSVATDITPMKRAKEKLAESEERLKLFIEKTPAAIAIFDENMNYIFASQRWYKDYNIQEDVIGRHHYDVFPDLPDKWKKANNSTLKDGIIHSMDEDLFIRKDGTVKWLHWESHPWYKNRNEIGGMILFTEDITDRVKSRENLAAYSLELEHKTRQLETALEEVEEASNAKSIFLACMSHELRTPLNAIIGFSEVMQSQVFGALGNQKYLEYSKDIHASGTHLLSLIEDVLDLSKIEAGKIELREELTNISDLAKDALLLVESKATEKAIEIKSNFAEPMSMYLDPKAIRQVMINLLGNALKFTPYGGVIEINCRTDRQTGNVHLSVKDTGIGIPDTVLPNLFTPFYQGKGDYSSKNPNEGAGLGLTIVKNLVEKHGGSVDITSTLGKGTEITVTLPKERIAVSQQLARYV